METLVDLFLHFDSHMAGFVAAYGSWVYGMLFLIVFAETGLVVTPFLPGDSLLFAAGALSAAGGLDAAGLSLLLVGAAVLGDAVNYSVGRFVGPHVFTASDHRGFLHRLLNRDHLTRAHGFFERYGGKAVVLALNTGSTDRGRHAAPWSAAGTMCRVFDIRRQACGARS